MRFAVKLTHRQRNRAVPAFAGLLIAILSGSQVFSQGLTYVDADDGYFSSTPNLRAAESGLQLSDVLLDTGGYANGDNKWGFREFGAGGTLFTANDSTPYEEAPEIVQTISGLTSEASYDVYVAYWSSETFDWGVRAGLTSNPGNNQLFNRNGPFAQVPTAMAGIYAASVAWTSPPLDNPTPSNDAQGVFREGDRDMFLGFVGTASASSFGELDVFIDDLSPLAFAGQNSFRRSWFDGVAYAPAGTVLAPVLTIDHNTGAMTLTNDTGVNYTVAGYSITSAVGGLDPLAWTRVSDTDPWSVVSQTAYDLSESEDFGGDGGALLAANGGLLELGDAWLSTPSQDVQVTLTLADSSVLRPIVQYLGTAIPTGDFTADGQVTLADFQVLLDNLQSSVAGKSTAEAYLLGNLNGDEFVNLLDFLAFKTAYDDFNGEGAFNAAFSTVPEPGSFVLALTVLCSTLLAIRRKCGSRR